MVSFGGRVFGRTLYILTQILLARILGPEGFGIYAIGWTLLRMAGPVSILGLDYGIIRFGSAYWQENSTVFRAAIRQSFGIVLISGLLFIAIAFGIIHFFLESFLDKSIVAILQLASIGLLFSNLHRAISATTLVSQRMIFPVRLDELIQPICNLGLVICFAWVIKGEQGSFLALVLSFVVTAVWGYKYLRDLFPEIFETNSSDPWLIKPILSFSIPAGLSSLASFYIFWIDRLILGYYTSPKDVGIYQAASQSSLLFATILASINAIFVPIIADLLAAKKTNHLEELFRVSTKWGLYFSIPLALIFLLEPSAYLHLTFGSEYSLGYTSLRILTVAQLINLATGAINLILLMGGYQIVWMLLSGLMLIINIVANILLIPQFGIVGAAWGTAVSIGGLSILGLLFTRKKIGVWPYDRRFLKGAAAFAISLFGGILVKIVQIPSMTLEFFVMAIVVVLLYGSTIWIFGIEAEDKTFIAMLKARLPQKTST